MRRRSFLIWAGLAAILLALVNLPVPVARAVKAAVREAAAPLQSLWTGFSARVQAASGTIRGLGGLSERNRELEAELLLLRSENRSLQAYQEENDQLRRLLGFQARQTRRLISAEVISRDASGWWQSLRLGRGLQSGIGVDRAVVTPDGLVGRTVEVTPGTTEVLLISDPACRVAAEAPRTGSFGVVTGQGVRWDGRVVCRMSFINRNHEVRVGDAVITSGLGGIFPRGLVIGYVESVDRVETNAVGLYRSAAILPRADLGALRHVFVLDEATGEDGTP